jgi:hypothetical protein
MSQGFDLKVLHGKADEDPRVRERGVPARSRESVSGGLGRL